jgi:hypothetical protein
MATTRIPELLEPGTGQGPTPAPDVLARFARWLAEHSITALRISLGLVIAGPGGRQILLADPAGDLIELFQPAHRPTSPAEPS